MAMDGDEMKKGVDICNADGCRGPVKHRGLCLKCWLNANERFDAKERKFALPPGDGDPLMNGETVRKTVSDISRSKTSKPVEPPPASAKDDRTIAKGNQMANEKTKALCRVPGCIRPESARGICATHHYRWKNGKDEEQRTLVAAHILPSKKSGTDATGTTVADAKAPEPTAPTGHQAVRKEAAAGTATISPVCQQARAIAEALGLAEIPAEVFGEENAICLLNPTTLQVAIMAFDGSITGVRLQVVL